MDPMDPNFTTRKLAGWIALIILSGSTMAISMPLLVHGFASKYFVLFLSSLEFVLLFGGSILVMASCCDPTPSPEDYQYVNDVPTSPLNTQEEDQEQQVKVTVPGLKRQRFLPLVYSGIANSFSALFLTYASDPSNTPVELQSILASLIIIPSFCMRKWYLKRETQYDWKLLGASVVFLLGGLIIGVLPLFTQSNDSSSERSVAPWIIFYTMGTILRAAANIYQEEYYITTHDCSKRSKIFVVFVSRVVQLVTVILLFWCDPAFQRQSFANSWQDFAQSWTEGFVSSTYGLLFQLYIVSFLVYFYSSVTLNAVSTNINVISSMMITPCMMLFFQVFSQLNPGMHFAWWVTLSCLTCNMLSTFFWVRAEKDVASLK